MKESASDYNAEFDDDLNDLERDEDLKHAGYLLQKLFDFTDEQLLEDFKWAEQEVESNPELQCSKEELGRGFQDLMRRIREAESEKGK